MASPGDLLITVDVEDWYHMPAVSGAPFSVYRDANQFFKEWSGKYDYLTRPTERTLDLFDEFDVTATFFVVADVLERYPNLVEKIASRGHEIACHGLHHVCKLDPRTKGPLMTGKEFEARTAKAKTMLEEACKKEVVGYRAPNALVAGWMLDVLRKIGFKYDSSVSVNSLYSKTGSPRTGASSFPYYVRNTSLEVADNGDFVEFPWAYWNVFGLKIPCSGGPMLRFLGAHIILQGLRQSLERGHTVFYFHPIDISNERFPRIGRGRPMYWAVKGKVVEERIAYILSSLKKDGTVSRTCGAALTEYV